MKTTIFSLSLLKFLVLLMVFVDYKSNSNVQERINNSLVHLKVSTENGSISGSGTLIQINGSNYVLTNAHVCLGTELEKAMKNKIANLTYQYEINSRNLYSVIDYEYSDLIYNLDEDWCVVPVSSTIDFPIITEKIVEHNFTNRATTVTYNRGDNKEIARFNACATVEFFFSKDKEKSCTKMPQPNGEMSFGFISSSGENQNFMSLKENYTYQFPTIPGDSGSPVYNSKNKLIGLVSATHIGEGKNPNYGFVSSIRSFKRRVMVQN